MLTGSLCRAFSSTTPRFGARLAPLLGRKSSRWWQRLERNGGDGAEGCKAGVAHLKTLQLSWEIHGEGRDGFLKSHMVLSRLEHPQNVCLPFNETAVIFKFFWLSFFGFQRQHTTGRRTSFWTGTPTVVITPRGQLDLSAARALASALAQNPSSTRWNFWRRDVGYIRHNHEIIGGISTIVVNILLIMVDIWLYYIWLMMVNTITSGGFVGASSIICLGKACPYPTMGVSQRFNMFKQWIARCFLGLQLGVHVSLWKCTSHQPLQKCHCSG